MILFPELTKLINFIYYSSCFFMKYYKNNDNEKISEELLKIYYREQRLN